MRGIGSRRGGPKPKEVRHTGLRRKKTVDRPSKSWGGILGVIFHQVVQKSQPLEALLRAGVNESHVAPPAVIDPQIAGEPTIAFL